MRTFRRRLVHHLLMQSGLGLHGVPEGAASHRDVLPLRDASRTWFAVSLQTFGGPAGQIAVMQRILVDEKRWIGQGRFFMR